MLHSNWNYGIEKNWDYYLCPEIMDSNIFCYGRGGTGKTELVALPVAHNAIDEGRSCIIYSENAADDYADVRERAFLSGYDIYDLTVENIESFREIRTARKIAQKILEGRQVFVVATNPKFRMHKTSARSLIR